MGLRNVKTHLLEVARAIMFTTNVPKIYWGEAILIASYLINRMPSRVLKFKTPISVFLDSYPQNHLVTSNLALKTFGCTAFVYLPSLQRTKLSPRAIKSLFLRYSPTKKGYKCYNSLTKKLFVTMDVKFFENQPFYPSNSLQGQNLREDDSWDLLDILEPKMLSNSSLEPNMFSSSSLKPNIPSNSSL